MPEAIKAVADLPPREELRKMWIEALRSGEYEQGRDHLRDPDGGYCCLGVLCHLVGIMDERGNATIGTDNLDEDLQYQDSVSCNVLCPLPLAKHVGIIGTSGDHRGGHFTAPTLARMNDDGKTFNQIADALESGDYWKENE
jgi:hypothetical protein